MDRLSSRDAMAPNIIIADAEYIDRVAFDLIVNFERMLMRPIPPADLAQWAVCVALDGGLRPGPHQTQVVLVHRKETTRLENFLPSSMAEELTGKAFSDERLGEFTICPLSAENLVAKEDLLLDVLGTVCRQKEVERVMVIPDAETGTTYEDVRATLRHLDDDSKRITVFAMQPMPGGNFRQEILGYSLMNALGIRSEEIGHQAI